VTGAAREVASLASSSYEKGESTHQLVLETKLLPSALPLN
jgi:hypothetical protein